MMSSQSNPIDYNFISNGIIGIEKNTEEIL